MSNTIKVWNLGTVSIYPHLSWEKLLTYEELVELSKKINTHTEDDFKIYVFDVSSYSYEVNGKWNVIFSITTTDDLHKYIYMIRRDKELNKTFGCPMINREYMDHPMYEKPLHFNEELLKKFELILENYLQNGEYINCFEC